MSGEEFTPEEITDPRTRAEISFIANEIMKLVDPILDGKRADIVVNSLYMVLLEGMNRVASDAAEHREACLQMSHAFKVESENWDGKDNDEADA